MKSRQTDVFIHVDELLEAERFAALQNALGAVSGVDDVQPSARRHLVRVVYDPSATRAQAIVGQIRRQGLHAQAVGL